VNVTLTPSLDLLLSRMAKHTRTSKSQVLRELLESAEPALQRAVTLMDAATAATQAVKDGLSKSLDKAQAQAEKALAKQMGMMDSLSHDLVAQAEAIRERRPGRSGTGCDTGAPSPAGVGTDGVPSNPPASNRGGKSVAKRKEQGTRRGVVRSDKVSS
jgi:hypothetical protein